MKKQILELRNPLINRIYEYSKGCEYDQDGKLYIKCVKHGSNAHSMVLLNNTEWEPTIKFLIELERFEQDGYTVDYRLNPSLQKAIERHNSNTKVAGRIAGVYHLANKEIGFSIHYEEVNLVIVDYGTGRIEQRTHKVKDFPIKGDNLISNLMSYACHKSPYIVSEKPRNIISKRCGRPHEVNREEFKASSESYVYHKYQHYGKGNSKRILRAIDMDRNGKMSMKRMSVAS